ncbi:MAG: MurR/RpiR family transcriptional regulator [Lactovum sp.]
MSIKIYERIKSGAAYQDLSDSQKDVHQYIIRNIHRIQEVTIEEIGKNCYCSNTTVNRYCKKMGASGFTEVKHLLIEYSTNFDLIYKQQVNTDIINKMNHIDFSNLDEILKIIKTADTIYLFGTGASYLFAKYLERLLIRSGINTFCSNEAGYISIIKKVETCIIISNTGETHSAVSVASQLKDKNVISITKKNSRVEKLSTYSIAHTEDLKVNDSIQNELNISCFLAIITLISRLEES